ncbi:MAG: chloride channel protein [Acidobacteriota bacterium]
MRRARVRLLGLFGRPIEVRHKLRAARTQVLRWVAFSAFLGMVTGALVAVFDFLLREEVVPIVYGLRLSPVYLLLPMAGLLLSNALTRYAVPSKEGALTEAYIARYHSSNARFSWTDLPGKLAASFVTLSTGGSLGLEGPSIFLGSSLGEAIQRRFRDVFKGEDARLLMVAGAAAGVAAIFKAPLTGLLFALEALHRDGIAGRAFIPAMVASASSYVTFALLAGSEVLFAVETHRAFDLHDLIWAIPLGVCCGLLARFFSRLVRSTRTLFERLPRWARPLLAGLVLGLAGVLVFRVAGEPFLYGPGYRLVQHVLAGSEPLETVLLFWCAKAFATALTLAGGGVGGVFFPLVVLGTLTGSAFGRTVVGSSDSLYPLVGLAAFVGAGYRTPVAAVAFVAETTGNPWALIPAMVATVAGYLSIGGEGISDAQRSVAGDSRN